MAIDHLTREEMAIPVLSSHLQAGTLVLFLGAGASLGAGLPDWYTLICRLCKAVGLPTDGITPASSADALQTAADDVRSRMKDDADFVQLVNRSLYEGVTLSPALLRDDLLIALGALMMGSRRGKVSRVVTFNFDSVLEWYMSLCGMVPRAILLPPTLEGAEDVRVYHPHGFLTHPDQKLSDSTFVILGLDAVNKRLGTSGDVWFEMLRHLLRSGLALFIGVSPTTFRDRALAPLLVTVGEELRTTRPTAFWLMVCNTNDYDKYRGEFLRHNVVPLHMDGKDKVPPFLLSICQAAAQSVIM